MNTLALIKKNILKARAQADAQVLVTRYRGVECQAHTEAQEVHGTFCYRGRSYTK